jgi:16S rRNA G966 N2-methylase RsmD
MEEDLQKDALAALGEINGHILHLLKKEYFATNPEVKEAIFEWLSTLVQIVHEEFVIMDEVIE